MSDLPAVRQDSILNAATGAGVTTRDRTLATRPDTSVRCLTEDEIVALAREPYARRLLTIPSGLCTRKGWSFLVDGKEDTPLGEKLEAEQRRIGLVKALRLADEWGIGMLGGCGVALRVADAEQSAPIAKGRIKLVGATTYWPTQFYPNRESYVTDPISEAYGEPEFYDLNSALGSQAVTAKLHASRVLTMTGPQVAGSYQIDTPTNGLWPYTSTLDLAWPALRKLMTVEKGAENAVHALRLMAIKGPWHELIDENGNDAALMRRMHQLVLGFSDHQAAILNKSGGAGDEEIEFHSLDLRGIIDIIRHFCSALAASQGYSMTLLMGEAPAGLSTDDASGTRNVRELMEARQIEKYEPALLKAARIMAQAVDGTADADISIEFHSLEAKPGPKEKAETELLEAQASAIYAQWDGLEDPRGMVDKVTQVGAPQPSDSPDVPSR